VATAPAAKAAQVLKQTADNIKNAHKTAANAAGQAAKKELLDQAAKVSSGGRLRNVGKSGAKLGVGYEVSTLGNGARLTVKAKGPWQIVESGNRPHRIGPRKKGGRRAVSFGGRAYARVQHPGTKGKRPWEKGEKAAAPKVEKILAEKYIKAVSSAW
jgi:hypothetical protein